MNKSGWWIAVAGVTWLVIACDPNKTPRPAEPPKPIAQLMKTQHLDDLPR